METGLLKLQPWEECKDLSIFVGQLKKARELQKKIENFNYQYLRDKLYTFDEIIGVEGLCWFSPKNCHFPIRFLDCFRELLPDIGIEKQKHPITYDYKVNYNILVPIISLVPERGDYSQTEQGKFCRSFYDGVYDEKTGRIKRYRMSQIDSYLDPGKLKNKIRDLFGYKSPVLESFIIVSIVLNILERFYEQKVNLDTKESILDKIKILLRDEVDPRLFVKDGKDWHWIASELSEEVNDDLQEYQFYSLQRRDGLTPLFWIDKYRCPWFVGDDETIERSKVTVDRESGVVEYEFYGDQLYSLGSRKYDKLHGYDNNFLYSGTRYFFEYYGLKIYKGLKVRIDQNEILGPQIPSLNEDGAIWMI